MGYEVTYKYHEMVDGEYNKNELKLKTVKIGNPYEEMQPEILAGKIIAQLARRNILVVDVEIYEFIKKKLTFKQTDDGILIKNRKYSFDDGALVSTEEVVEQQEQEKPTQSNIVVKSAVKAVLRHEVFEPDVDELYKATKQKGYHFTLGKKYPIFAEKSSGNRQVGMLYTTNDDTGKEVILSEHHFHPPVSLGQFDEPPDYGKQNILRGEFDNSRNDMPILRRR